MPDEVPAGALDTDAGVGSVATLLRRTGPGLTTALFGGPGVAALGTKRQTLGTRFLGLLVAHAIAGFVVFRRTKC